MEFRQKRLNPRAAQKKQLIHLMRRAQFTAFGEHFNFDEILSDQDVLKSFKEKVPVSDYNSMYKNWWYRALNGEAYVSWPGRVKYFALSSGTSESSSKHIPVTAEMLSSIKGQVCVNWFRLQNTNSRFSFTKRDFNDWRKHPFAI